MQMQAPDSRPDIGERADDAQAHRGIHHVGRHTVGPRPHYGGAMTTRWPATTRRDVDPDRG
jgi:hypothetical protein